MSLADSAVLSLTPNQLARTLANAVARERRRCAGIARDMANEVRGRAEVTHEDLQSADNLDELAERLLDPHNAVRPAIVPVEREEYVQDFDHEPPTDAILDALPPHVDRDDEEEGIALLRARGSFGRAITTLRD